MEYFTLNNGIKMPMLGFGTSNLKGMECQNAVRDAIEVGYRHIDTASSYYNEKAVGRGIKDSGINREELFITVKVWPSHYVEAHKSIEDSFRRLQIDYADMAIVHHPCGDYDACYQAFEELYNDGKIKSIGLSNFSIPQIQYFLDDYTIKPSLVTVEAHPYNSQYILQEYLEKYNLVMEAWYPLGHGDKNLIQEPIILSLSKKYKKSPVQIILRWHIQMDHSVLPSSKNKDHIFDNYNIFDFNIEREDMGKIAQLNKNQLYKEFDDAMWNRFLDWHPDFDDQE